MPFHNFYQGRKRDGNIAYQGRGFETLRNDERRHENESQGHLAYSLSGVTPYAIWFIACTFVIAILNTDWGLGSTLQESALIRTTFNVRPVTQQTLGLLPTEFVSANESAIHYVGRWVLSYENYGRTVIEPMYPFSYVDLHHNSSTISIELFEKSNLRKTSTKMNGLTILKPALSYTVSLNETESFYQPVSIVGPGNITLGVHTILEKYTGFKTTRVIFPLAGGSKDLNHVGLLGFYVDPYTSQSSRPRLNGYSTEVGQGTTIVKSRKLLEVITDSTGGYFVSNLSIGGKSGKQAESLPLASLALHWGWRLGEIFGADRRIVGIDGACLVSEYPNLNMTKKSLQDVYFKSGLPGSEYEDIPWNFASEQRPDVIVLSLGHSDVDYLSVIQSTSGINVPLVTGALIERFENSYVNFVRHIRQLAYPVHFDTQSGLEYAGEMEMGCPKVEIQRVIPIYLLYPFSNRELADSVKRVAARLAKGEEEGYRGVAETNIFEIDTSSWLSMHEGDIVIEPWMPTTSQDTVFNNGSQIDRFEKWKLTAIGHEKAAIYMRSRLCRYLATNLRTECGQALQGLDSGVTRGVSPGAVRKRGPSPNGQRWRQQEADAREQKLRGSFVW